MVELKKLKSEEVKEEDKLIECVVTEYYQYLSYMNEILSELNSPMFAPLKIGNEFNVNPKTVKKKSSNDKQTVLVDTLLRLGRAYREVNLLDNFYQNLMYKRKALMKSLNNLEHFYIYTKAKSKQKRKIKTLKNAIVKVPSEIVKPLCNLKGTKDCIDEFTANHKHNFNQIDHLLKKGNDGQCILNKDGYYVVDKEYFTTRFYKTIGNIKTIINKQFKKFHKINNAHKNETQLSNYLKFY